MKIAILGSGSMGAWFASNLSSDNDVMIVETSPKFPGSPKVKTAKDVSELKSFSPDLVLNTANHNDAFALFDAAIAFSPAGAALADVMPIKSEIAKYYESKKRRFISLHPMFTPGDKTDFSNQYAVIVKESDSSLKEIFRKYFESFKIKVFEYDFVKHDEMAAYTLAVPFISSMVFASCTKIEDAPGTTYNKHLDITRGLLSEDDYVLAELLFNPRALNEIEMINSKLSYLTHIIKAEDYDEVHKIFSELRKNIK